MDWDEVQRVLRTHLPRELRWWHQRQRCRACGGPYPCPARRAALRAIDGRQRNGWPSWLG